MCNSLTSDAIREIVYRFGDASVPPEFHRSYEIRLTLDRVEVAVDSYGDVLATRSYQVSADQCEDIVLSLRQNVTLRAQLEEDDGCTGGTSETITVSDGEKTIFSGTVYHCGGKDSGTLGGDVARFAEDIKRLTPDLKELLSRA